MSKPMKEKNTTDAAATTPHGPKEVGSKPKRTWVSVASLTPVVSAAAGCAGGMNGVQLAGST